MVVCLPHVFLRYYILLQLVNKLPVLFLEFNSLLGCKATWILFHILQEVTHLFTLRRINVSCSHASVNRVSIDVVFLVVGCKRSRFHLHRASHVLVVVRNIFHLQVFILLLQQVFNLRQCLGFVGITLPMHVHVQLN